MFKNFNADKKRLTSNFFSLSSVEVANYIFPLITLPYLVRVLGPEKYGLIAFAQAFIQYFGLLTDYGFNLSATRNISVNREDKEKVSKIFSSVMTIKMVLMAFSFVIMSTLVFVIPRFRVDWLLYFFTFGVVIGNALFPIWFFQGVERMKFIAFLNLLAKFIFVVAIFVFVKSATDYIYVPLLTSFGFITAGVSSLFIVWKRFKVKFSLPSLPEITYELREGQNIFVSSISTNLYTTTNTFLLGIFTNNTVVGYFAAGEKIVRALIRMFNPVFQSVYPHISKVAAASKEEAIRKLRKLFALSLYLSLPLFFIVLIFADSIAGIVLGPKFIKSALIMRIFSPLLLVIPSAYIFANLGLLPFRLDKYFLRIYASGALLNIILIVVFVGALQLAGIGAALSNLITESVLTILMYFVLKKNNIIIF